MAGLARRLLRNCSVRVFVAILLLVSAGFFYLRQQRSQAVRASAQPVPAASPALNPAPRGQASEYNYMKRALDRAQDMRDQSRARTEEAQQP